MQLILTLDEGNVATHDFSLGHETEKSHFRAVISLPSVSLRLLVASAVKNVLYFISLYRQHHDEKGEMTLKQTD